MSQSVTQKNWFTVFNVKITVRAYMIKIWLFLLYLLKCWSVCNQIWFDSTASEAGVSCGKTGLLHSRSRSQWRFSMSVNVWLEWYLLNCRIFCYQTWYGYAASWARVSCRKKYVCYLQGQGHSKGSCDEDMTFYYIFWTVDSFATKLGLMINFHKP